MSNCMIQIPHMPICTLIIFPCTILVPHHIFVTYTMTLQKLSPYLLHDPEEIEETK